MKILYSGPQALTTVLLCPAGKAPSVLMLSPTRELAMQIAAVMEEAGSRAGLITVCVYGGVPKHTQAAILKKGVNIIVATPGRLKVHITTAPRKSGLQGFL